MKIKQIVKTEEVIEKEISLPYFCKHIDQVTGNITLFKVMGDRTIDVMPGTTKSSYKSVSSYSNGVNEGKIGQSVEITEDEFNEAYHKALMEIGKYVPVPDAPIALMSEEENELAQYQIDNK